MKTKTAFKVLMCALISGSVLQVCAATSGDMNMSGSFAGWRQLGDANWQIDNGEFVATSGSGHLVTRQNFADFHLSAEFYVDSGTANSGVFFHITNPDAVADTTAYEANIYDERPDQSGRTGGLVNFAAPAAVINAAGQWNSYDIRVQGDHIVIRLNGVTTVDVHESAHPDAGPVSLQYGSGEVRFRNVHIEPL